MKESKIQWTDHTWNVAVGCKKVSEGCKFCYMYRDEENRFKRDASIVRRTKPATFNAPLNWKEPALVFTSSLTDLFAEECDGFREEAWEIIRKSPHLTFQILTKRPERIKANLPKDWGSTGYANVWLGVSVENQARAVERIPKLATIPARCRFLSVEPMLESIAFDEYGIGKLLREIHWVIVGGESGNETGKYRYRAISLVSIYALIVRMKISGIPVFVKQLGTHEANAMGLKDRHGGDMSEWPKELQVREMPKGYRGI